MIQEQRYDHCKRRNFERIGCLITANGEQDELVKPEGLPNYILTPPRSVVLPRMLQDEHEMEGREDEQEEDVILTELESGEDFQVVD